jgi:NAD(P)-dependent dehydrogenase (short-subunit alcohol dehydrogenase family)
MAAKYPFSVDGNEFQDKQVLVTGGTKGMGEAIVSRLTMGGGSVTTIARSPLPKGQQPADGTFPFLNGSLRRGN